MEKKISNSKKTTVKTKHNSKVRTSNSKIHKTKLNLSAITIIFIVAILATLVGIYFGVRFCIISLKYKYFTDKMYEYGYNNLYANEKASSMEKLSNAEMIKVVLGIVKNTDNVSRLYYTNDQKMAEEVKWLEAANSFGLNSKVTKENLENRATKIDAAILATKCIEKLLNEKIDKADLKMNSTKLAKYTAEDQEYISKAVTLGLIKNKNSEISEKMLLKGELNKIVITIVEKYSTIYYGKFKVNENGELVNQNINIVTDKEKMPENYKEYPYIIDSIDKDIYELEYNVMTQSTFQTPKEAYELMGDLYMQIDNLVTDYFAKILNVDYQTITEEDFMNSIKGKVVYGITTYDVKEYVDYVKANKIKLEGKATPLLPIMYNTGEQYVIRTKLTFKVVNSNTDTNLLFGDEDYNVKYTGNEFEIYVDVPTGMTMDSRSLRIYISSMANNLAKPSSNITVTK